MTKFGLSRVLDRFSIYSHHNNKKIIRVEVSKYLIEQVANDTDYLNNEITTDDTCTYCYDPVLKQEISKWVPWRFSYSLKPCTAKSKMKCMVTSFFNREGLVYTHTVPDGETVNADWYVELLKWLIMVHIPCKWHYCNAQWKLYHDNVHPTYSAACSGFLDLAWCRTDSICSLQPRSRGLWSFPISYRNGEYLEGVLINTA